MKGRNWYMEGWVYKQVPVEGGGSRRKLVYTGAYYSFGLPVRKLRHIKAAVLALALTMYAALGAASLMPSQGGRTWYSGLFAMLALIPYIYLGMGAVCLVAAKDPMTYRSYYASITRVRYASAVSGVLLCLAVLGQLSAMVVRLFKSQACPTAEWLWLLGVFACAAAAGGIVLLLLRHPVTAVNNR